MADSTIGSLYSIRRGLENDLVELQTILQKQGIDRHQIPFRPHIVNIPVEGSTTMYFPRWYPDDVHQLQNLRTYGFDKFNPNNPKKADIHAASNLAFLNNSEVRKDITIDVEIPYARTGKRGQCRYARFTGKSVADIFKTQNSMIPITSIYDRIIPLSYYEYVNNRGRFNPWREDVTSFVPSVTINADGTLSNTSYGYIGLPMVPDVMRVDFFIMEDLHDFFYTGNQMYPAWGNGAPFGGLLVFPHFLFPMRYTTAEPNSDPMYPRYGIKGSGDKLSPNVMDFYKFKYDTDLQRMDVLTRTANIYLTKHEGMPPNDASHIHIGETVVAKGWRYPDTPNNKVVYPNIIYAMTPTGLDYGTTKFNLYTSWKRLSSNGSAVQSAYDVGKVDDLAPTAGVPFPDMGVMKTSILQIQSPTSADFTDHQTLPDTAKIPIGMTMRFALDQNYCREYPKERQSDTVVSNIMGASAIRSQFTNSREYNTVADWSGLLVNFAYNNRRDAWPGNWHFSNALSMSLSAVSNKTHQLTSFRGKHPWDSLWDPRMKGQNDNVPYTYFGIQNAGIYQWNYNDDFGTDNADVLGKFADSAYQVYPDWNNYQGRSYTSSGTLRERWSNKLYGRIYSIRQNSHRGAIDHMDNIAFSWGVNATTQNPFFREMYAFDGIQPIREEIWYRNYVHAKTGREIFLALACAGQRLFINDASTPNAPTWREVDIPLLPNEYIKGICEYKGFYLLYTLFGYFFTTDFIDFEYCDVIPDDKIRRNASDRPTIENIKDPFPIAPDKDWFNTNLSPFSTSSIIENSDNYYVIDNMKIVEGYIYAAIKSNCLWTADDKTTDAPKNRTFHYQILRSKYPIFKQLYEYVTPYDVYINHSYVDIYGRKKYGFKTNPEFLIGGARQHRLYTPAHVVIEQAVNSLLSRKVYDNIVKCVEFKGELYALKFRFSMPNFYFERPELTDTVWAGPIHDLMRTIPDVDHLRAEARVEKLYPGLASQDNAEYTEPIWVMNRELANSQIGGGRDITWNDYLVWGLYDLSNFSNVVASRALTPKLSSDVQTYAYKKGFLASPTHGSFAMEVIDGKLVVSFTCLSNKYGIYSSNYTQFSTTLGSAGWTPATTNHMTNTGKIMMIFDGESIFQSDPGYSYWPWDKDWGISYYLTKHPKWSTHRPTGDFTIHGAPEGIDWEEGGDAFYMLAGWRSPTTELATPSSSFSLLGDGSSNAVKTVAKKITGTTDVSSDTTLKFPVCPPPGFLMPTTAYRYGLAKGTGVTDGMYENSPADYRTVHFHTIGVRLRKDARFTIAPSIYDIVGNVMPSKYPMNWMRLIKQDAHSTYINMKFLSPSMVKPSDIPASYGAHESFFNGFRVLNDRILALFGFTVADITQYNAKNNSYFQTSKASGDTIINLNSITGVHVLDVFKPAFAETKEALSDKRSMGQLFISPHDSIPVYSDGTTIIHTRNSPGAENAYQMVDYTIDVQYIDGKYYQFLPGSIFVHEHTPCWNYTVNIWDSKIKTPPMEMPYYRWTHKVLWTTPLTRATNPDDENQTNGGTIAPTPTFNFWQINGRKPIYMNGYFFLPWCGLYVDLYGKTHSIPETSDFSPSETCSRFVAKNTLGGNYSERLALNEIGNRPGNEDSYYNLEANIYQILPYTNYTDGNTPPVTWEGSAYPTTCNYSGWNQFYKCGNRLYAYMPSAIGSQIQYIWSKSFYGTNVVNCIPYDMRPGVQEYLAMTEYTGHKPQFYHKKINFWDYQYQWETVNGASQNVNRVIMQNKPYLMIDFPFHPTKVIVVSRDRKLIISEYREFEFNAFHGLFNATARDVDAHGEMLTIPVLTKRSAGQEQGRVFMTGDKYTSAFMAHAIRYEFQGDGGKMDLNMLQTEQENQIFPDENSWIDNNTVYIYNPRVGEKGPAVRQPVFDANGKIIGQGGVFYDELPSETSSGGQKTDYGYRFNVVDVYAWC